MRNVIISDGVESINLLNDIIFEIGTSEISTSATMASGRLVKDIVGYKDTLNIPVGYLSVEDMSKLRKMIRRNSGYLQISYPAPEGDTTEWFIMDQPTYSAFTYDENGVATWKGVTLTATSVEVQQ